MRDLGVEENKTLKFKCWRKRIWRDGLDSSGRG